MPLVWVPTWNTMQPFWSEPKRILRVRLHARVNSPPSTTTHRALTDAELILYGATEPDAAVTVGGRTIKLRPDGTFSYRFALPDGHYELPAVATSADGTDARRADLHFARSTEYSGEVGAHPQDAALKPPRVEYVA